MPVSSQVSATWHTRSVLSVGAANSHSLDLQEVDGCSPSPTINRLPMGILRLASVDNTRNGQHGEGGSGGGSGGCGRSSQQPYQQSYLVLTNYSHHTRAHWLKKKKK